MSQLPKTVETAADLGACLKKWRSEGETIALVPTMGALHKGHLSLVERARRKADRVIVSIFINPKQFGADEDLKTYPRDLDGDLVQLAKTGTDLVYVPGTKQIYPAGYCTTISVAGLSDGLCSKSRPHFFDGVATVVGKLLLQCAPDIAVFGEKDYQQLLIIKRLVIDFGLPVEIIGAPLVREADGLALSSRNAYLSPDERQTAPLLHKVLQETRKQLEKGEPVATTVAKAQERLGKAGFELDYLELRDAETLAPLSRFEQKPARLLIAALLGRTRLIDNIAVMG